MNLNPNQQNTKHILISGYYGFGNTGDEAILGGMIRQIKEKTLDCDFIVVSENPDETKRVHGVEAISRLDFAAISWEIEKSDLVILGGGGLFQDHHKIEISSIFTKPGLGIASYAIVPLIAAMHLKPVIFYSQGFGPLFSKESKTFVSFVCNLADVITVRDHSSKELLESLGIRPEKIIVSADPAIGILPADKDRVDEILKQENIRLEKEKIICISVRQWIDESIETRYINNIAHAIESFLEKHDVSIIFVPFQIYDDSNDDAEIASRIIEKISKKDKCYSISRVYNPSEIAGIVARADLVLGMRYHSIIFAALTNVPVVALSYDPKVTNLMKDLAIDELNYDIFREDPAHLEEIIIKAWNARTDLKNTIKLSFNALVKTNFGPDIVYSLLAGPKVQGIDMYKEMDFRSDNKTYKLKSIETIHNQGLLISSLQKQADSLQSQKDLLQSQKDSLQSQKDSLQSQKDSLQSQINMLQSEKISLGNNIDSLEKLNNSLEKQISSLQEQNKSLDYALRETQSSRAWKVLNFTWVNMIRIKRSILALGAILLPKPFRKILFRETIQRQESIKDDLTQFLRAASRKKDKENFIVVFSGTRFVENEGQRPTRLAEELEKIGNHVLFAYWRWSPAECSDYGIRSDRIFLIAIDQLLNHTKNIFEFEFPEETHKILLIEFSHPSTFELISLSNSYGWVTVYDVMDDWEEFNKVGQADWYDKSLEQYIALNSDLVTTVSPKLLEKLKNYGASNVKLLPNAFDPDVLIDKPVLSLKKGKITIGYFGHLTSSWFDWDLLIGLAKKHNDWIFHLIGYGEPQIILPSNIYLHGKVEPGDLSSYAKNWDVAIIPFIVSKLAESVDPIKIYEYLHLRLPVVVQGIPHLERYPYVLIANNKEEFENCIEKASNMQIQDVTDFIENNTWKKRVNTLLEEINKARKQNSLKNIVLKEDK